MYVQIFTAHRLQTVNVVTHCVKIYFKNLFRSEVLVSLFVGISNKYDLLLNIKFVEPEWFFFLCNRGNAILC